MRDLVDRQDVEALVEGFYREVLADSLLGPIFTEVARIDLTRHLPIMADFWETVLFAAGTYQRNALQVHRALHAKTPLGEVQFARWLELWEEAVRGRFAGEKADLALIQAHRMAGSIERRLAGRSGSEFETLHHRTHPAVRTGSTLASTQ